MKKNIYLLFFSLITNTISLNAQINKSNDCKPFSLTVKVNNLDTGKIRIMYNNCNDSTAQYQLNLKNGEATFTGFINNATEAILVTDLSSATFSLDGPKVIRFIMESKPMRLSYSINNFGAYAIKINGSNSQNELEEWQKKYSSNLNLIDTLVEKYGPNLSIDEKAFNQLELNAAFHNITQNVKNYLLHNKDSYASVYLLKKYWRRMPIDTLQFYYSQLSKSAQQNEIGENLLNDILTLSSKDDSFVSKYGSKNLSKQLKFAKGFFDFSLLDTNNNTFNLNNFKDRYTFVNFWASWCEPCIKNMQAYEKLKRDYLNQQINFVSISIDKSSANWKKSLRNNKITGINLIDSDGILKSFYEIQGIPVYMIMKPDGNLADLEISKPGSPQLNKIIDTLLTKNTIKID